VALSLAIIADVVPEERRGRAMANVGIGMAVASIMGVPLALLIAEHVHWRGGMLVGTAGCALVLALAFVRLPVLRMHLESRAERVAISSLATRFDVWLAVGIVFLGGTAAMAVVPAVPSYAVENLGFPRGQLSAAYLVGGLVTVVGVQLGGLAVDKLGPSRVNAVATVLLAAVLWVGYLLAPFEGTLSIVSIYVAVSLHMALSAVLFTATSTLTSMVPVPAERGAFNSLLSIAVRGSWAIGSGMGSFILVTGPDGRLEHMDVLVWADIACGVLRIPLLPLIHAALMRRRGQQPQETA
jgi:predicted MFS family arabinose efflux permease